MKTTCTHCSQEVEVSDLPVNSELECPACHQKFTISDTAQKARPKIGIRKPGAISSAPAPQAAPEAPQMPQEEPPYEPVEGIDDDIPF